MKVDTDTVIKWMNRIATIWGIFAVIRGFYRHDGLAIGAGVFLTFVGYPLTGLLQRSDVTGDKDE